MRLPEHWRKQMATSRIQRFARTNIDGMRIFAPYFHIVVTTDEGVSFRHFHRFEGVHSYTDSDGNRILESRVGEAVRRAEALKARIDAAIERDGVYGLDRTYWDQI